MLINARVLAIVALMSCDVYARAAEDREPYRTAEDRKYSPGSMLTEIAKELVQRSTSSSQVTEINTTRRNFLSFLVSLKGLRCAQWRVGFTH